MGRPPPIIRAMPERKRFFCVDPFPYDDDDNGATHDSSCQSTPGPQCIVLESNQAGLGRI